MGDVPATADDLRAVAEYRRSFRMTHPTPEAVVSLADALDALRIAVKGCGKPFNLDPRMLSDVCKSTNRHCVSCKQAMWKAISRLLGTTDRERAL